MHLKDLIRAVAKEDLHDLLTPLATCVAFEIASKEWTMGDTLKYGAEIRDVIKTLGNQMPIELKEKS